MRGIIKTVLACLALAAPQAMAASRFSRMDASYFVGYQLKPRLTRAEVAENASSPRSSVVPPSFASVNLPKEKLRPASRANLRDTK